MPSSYRQNGFTLIELIMVIVITGILAGIVAIFIKTPVDQYLAIARRAAITDIADTAMRRMGRDIRTAVPNSVRLMTSSTSTYLEFLPTGVTVNGVFQGGGGRYRANSNGGSRCPADVGNDDALSFTATDSCFEILGPQITFTNNSSPNNDMIVVGSTQSDGNLPYQDPSSAGSIRRAYIGTIATSTSIVVITQTVALPYSAMIHPSYRFDIVPGSQQAVTYACENLGMDGGNGLGTLTRYWAYGFYPAQPTPAAIAAILASTTKSSAVLADKLSACSFVYTGSDPRNALVAISLTITQGYESVSLYQEVHVNNLP